MLQDIRRWAHGWMAWAVISLIAFVFVIWGVGANFGEMFGSLTSKPYAFKVGDVKITQAQWDERYHTMLEEYKTSLASQHQTFQPGDDAKVKEAAKDQMIMESVLNQFLFKTGFYISKEQADTYISSIPQLQEDGRFSMDIYQSLLTRLHQTPAEFLEMVRQRMVFTQASAAIGGSALVLSNEMEQAVALIYQTRDVGYAMIESKNFEKDIKITEDDLHAYYNGHHSEFTAPAEATIEYMTLSRKQIADEVRKKPVPENALQALYDAHVTDYTVPESRHISHILILVPENATEAVRTEKKKEAADILERLRSGASFASLAKEHSQDPGSATNGGDLGVVTKGSFDPAFDDAAFSAPKGQVVGPVETSFGYHLILVTDIQPATKEPLDKVRTALSDEWYQTEAGKAFDDDVKNLSDMAFQAGTNFADLAKQFNLTIDKATLSEDASKNSGVTTTQSVIDAAFDKAAYEQKLNSELLPINDDEAVVLHTTSLVESHLKPFDTVKPELEKAALARQSMLMAEQKAHAIQTALSQGKPMDAVEKEQGIVWQEAPKLDRRNRNVPMELVVAAFKTPLGEKPAFATVPMTTGVAVLEVKAIYPGTLPAFANQDEEHGFNENLRSQLGEFLARRDFQLFAQFAKRAIED